MRSRFTRPAATLPKDGSYTASGLTLGYYLVDSSLGALCGLTTTQPNATIQEKNEEPTIEKQVKEGETRTFYVHAEGLKALEKEEVTLTFYPRPQKYGDFNANWMLSKDVLEKEISTPSRT